MPLIILYAYYRAGDLCTTEPQKTSCPSGEFLYKQKCFKTTTDYIWWQRSEDNGISWNDIPIDQINNTLYNSCQKGEIIYFNLGILTEAKYRARITNLCGDTQYSEERIVASAPSVNVSADKIVYSVGDTPPILTMSYNNSESVIQSRKWKKKTGLVYNDIIGANGKTYNIT